MAILWIVSAIKSRIDLSGSDRRHSTSLLLTTALSSSDKRGDF